MRHVNKELRTLGSRPAANLASQIDTNDLRALELPRDVSHDVNGIGTANTARNHGETASVRDMRIRANHHTARECVVLEDDLMDDTRARLPELDTILFGSALQEVKDFAVVINGTLALQIRS